MMFGIFMIVSFTVAKILRVLKRDLRFFSLACGFTVAKILRVLKLKYCLTFALGCFTVAKILRVLKHRLLVCSFITVLQ